MDNDRRRGERGEMVTERYLLRRGYAVLERRWRCRYGELDIVARCGDGTVCFVEVKLRGPGSIAPPGVFVDERKQERLRRAAAMYLAQFPETDAPARFDVAEVYADTTPWQIHYIENAFE